MTDPDEDDENWAGEGFGEKHFEDPWDENAKGVSK